MSPKKIAPNAQGTRARALFGLNLLNRHFRKAAQLAAVQLIHPLLAQQLDGTHADAQVTTPAQLATQVVVQTEPATTGEGAPGVTPLGHAIPPTPEPAPPKHAPAHYLWAVLIARIYEVFPLLCPKCGGQMRLIAFITEGTRESGGFWSPSVSTSSHHTSPQRADHRCGTAAMRRWMRGAY